MPRVHRWVASLYEPVDIASLAFFRVWFAACMMWEVCRYFAHGWIEDYYIAPEVHFEYWGFGWVEPWPGDGMYWHFGVLGACALAIALGAFYRIAAVGFFLGFTYVFLLDQAQYLNHFYLICLLAFILACVPAHRAYSVDALRLPSLRSHTVPAWGLWLLRAQIGIAYFYGGIAKLNGDWLRGEPIRAWLAGTTEFPVVGAYFGREWVVYLFVYGGILIDLSVVPLLSFRRTRWFGLALAVCFHLVNARLFEIGIFPWLMLGATLLYFPPDWPRFGASMDRGASDRAPGAPAPALRQWVVASLLALYMAVQLLVPLRHWLHPGDVNWTEEGHNFSWHMKLRDKTATAEFLLTDPVHDTTWRVRPNQYLTARQERKMASRPELIHQFARFLAATIRRERGLERVEVRARVLASLNGREPAPLVDTSVDLAAEPRTFGAARWILPLTAPLPDPRARGPLRPFPSRGPSE